MEFATDHDAAPLRGRRITQNESFSGGPVSATFNILVNFKSSANGINPSGSLLIDANGDLFGTTQNGGGTNSEGGKQDDWGSAVYTSINGGMQYVFGSATDTAIEGGTQFVYGTATDTTLSSGGTTDLPDIQSVEAGGIANNTTIGAGGTEHVLAGGTANNVTFGGMSASLVLDQGFTFTGTIAGWQAHDTIDFGAIAFVSGTTAVGFVENSDNTGGTLTVSDGAHVATLALLGQYSAANFVLSGDANGGTYVIAPVTQDQAQNMLAPSHA
jgi:autotransporter passenger strand-loop-strand repeat protein